MKEDAVLNATLGLVSVLAVCLTGVVVARALRSGKPVSAPATAEVRDWRRFAEAGNRLGPSDASVTIVEFSDFQCPYCRVAFAALRDLRMKYPGQVAVIYRHYPLAQHPFARDAALAAECAASQGRFESFHDLAFAAQDSLGHRQWSSFARAAGVPNTAIFAECMRQRAFDGIIDRDVRAGDSLGVRGTPTILVNQRRILRTATLPLLDSLVHAALPSR